MVARTALAAVIGSLAASEVSANHGYKSSRPWKPREVVEGAVPAETLLSAATELPRDFDWRSVGGKNLVTADWNQHIPQYCGACWVHGTTSALNDRIKVLRGGAFPDVMLARQAIVNCVPDPTNASAPPPGCNGGDAYMIHEYLRDNKIPDESCMPYQARNMGCSANNVCRNCFAGGKGCFEVDKFIGYGVKTYGNLSGEAAMMKEIYARGPIACSFATDRHFMFTYTENVLKNEGVYVTDQKYTTEQIDHVMEVAGWGETPSGLKYWVIRNSWGTYWGNAGWVKLRRGVNQQLSESDCDWAVPTFDDLDEALLGKIMGDYVRGIGAVELPAGGISVAPIGGAGATLLETSAPGQPAEGATAPMLALTFTSGVLVALAAVRLTGRRLRQPPLLG
eukprot:TRINITY_DN45634_c0_g1_i1.p2 TRINITY_DN45634_c0_g1~~TRINITY_DN45634_c0_g1_i1.p2  ORF type:complete len:421 (+),score=103.25 TRINITY_DN45634_c0_g1_i1:84-1265(+)